MPISRRRLAAGFALAALLAALLAGCKAQPSAAPFGDAAADKVDCRIGGATAFDHACVVERTTGPDGLSLTIRHPDGGFRRLLVTQDGRGVIAADGAEPAVVTVEGQGILVTIGGDAYRLPATVKPAAAK